VRSRAHVTTFERGCNGSWDILGGFIAAGLLATVSGDVGIVVALSAGLRDLRGPAAQLRLAVTFLTPLVVLLVGSRAASSPWTASSTLIGAAIAGAARCRGRTAMQQPARAIAATLARTGYLDAVLAGRPLRPGRRGGRGDDSALRLPGWRAGAGAQPRRLWEVAAAAAPLRGHGRADAARPAP
jgi:hypothetical protein